MRSRSDVYNVMQNPLRPQGTGLPGSQIGNVSPGDSGGNVQLISISRSNFQLTHPHTHTHTYTLWGQQNIPETILWCLPEWQRYGPCYRARRYAAGRSFLNKKGRD